MKHLYTRLGWLLDALFPRSPSVAQFDRLPVQALGQCTDGVVAEHSYPCIAPLSYRSTLVREAVHASKYHGHARAAWLLGAAIAPTVADELSERQAFGEYLQPLVVPVPLHTSRLRERGFNQSARIALALADELELNYADQGKLLVRTKNTPSQAQQPDRKNRLRSMLGAFHADEAFVAEQYILLVDDVMTTGATLTSAREALLTAGARDVLCIAAAH